MHDTATSLLERQSDAQEHNTQSTASFIEAAEADENELNLANSNLPYSFAKRHNAVFESNTDGTYTLFYTGELTPHLVMETQRYLNREMQYQHLTQEDFERKLARHYDRADTGAQAMMDDISDEFDLNDVADAFGEPEDLLESDDEAPIIRLINALLTQAIKEDASDIHIETYENRMTIRMRVDGVLRSVLDPPRALAPRIISRLKIMSKLDIAEKRIPQDGRISLRVAGRPVDVRVSTLPSGQSERIVLRLLDKQAGRLNLSKLGMSEENEGRLNDLIKRPHGIVLVTGPTGSGKTTTLYASLTDLNESTRNILTVEDPIEYYLEGIGQTQVNNKVDMTFARGLRAILRQDPDVVMVGEIRDLETAEISIQASLTGHLVFSTLHTNTAVGVVARLRDMGVEPYLLSSSLIGIIAQRLVRVLCQHCRKPYTATSAECEILGVDTQAPPQLHHAHGCAKCNHLGYSGRSGIYEIIEINDTLRNMIHDGVSEMELEQAARKISASIRHDGMRQVLLGRTTLEEVLRVVTRE